MRSVARKGGHCLSISIALYAVFLATIASPFIQRHLIFLHRARWPINADFNAPERYGFAPGKVRNFYLDSSDSVSIGTWHVLPAIHYESYVSQHHVPETGHLSESVFDDALERYPTVLYFHGNAASRAAPNRIRIARAVSQLDANFIIIDYRGFADSTGVDPSEEGLVQDARAAWDWLTIAKGVPSSRIIVAGQSLGTGVSSALVSRLARENTGPASLVLVAGFSSIPNLLATYRLATVIPIVEPLYHLPGVKDLVYRILHTKFDTQSVIRDIACPILLVHADNDETVRGPHSETLFNHLLEAELERDCARSNKPAECIKTSRSSRVKTKKMGAWGFVNSFERPAQGKITWAQGRYGGHNAIETSEVTINLVKEIISSLETEK